MAVEDGSNANYLIEFNDSFLVYVLKFKMPLPHLSHSYTISMLMKEMKVCVLQRILSRLPEFCLVRIMNLQMSNIDKVSWVYCEDKLDLRALNNHSVTVTCSYKYMIYLNMEHCNDHFATITLFPTMVNSV